MFKNVKFFGVVDNFIFNHISTSELSVDLHGPFMIDNSLESTSHFLGVWIDTIAFKDSVNNLSFSEITSSEIKLVQVCICIFFYRIFFKFFTNC